MDKIDYFYYSDFPLIPGKVIFNCLNGLDHWNSVKDPERSGVCDVHINCPSD
jgi:hypothetical protein